MENTPRKRRRAPWIPAAALLAAAALCFAVPPLRAGLARVVALFAAADIGRMAAFLRSFGVWAAAVSFLLMVFQSVAAPLPAFLLTFANAMVWGWWRGALLSWSSAMAGAIVCFYIARLAGRGAAEKLTSRLALESVDGYFEKYGKNTVLICRLLPFVSFDFVSYAAGLTAMSPGAFLVATGLGQLPATLVYSYVGGMLTGSAKLAVTALMLTFALLAGAALFKKLYAAKNRGKGKD